MVKSLVVRPEVVRQRETLQLGEIEINSYNRSLAQEIKSGQITREDALTIYADMATIREFESMLSAIKTLGQYESVQYKHAGPAHLSIGQEAAAVGEAFLLGIDDHIYGSHRSHGEVIAKGLSAIHKLPGDDLDKILRETLGGRILQIVTRDGDSGSIRDIAIEFLLYGFLAEVFGRDAGFNRGMGGSMHMFFPPFGIYPCNAIVGGSADIAVGSALYKKTQKKPGVSIANIGDASTGCGPVWEALSFAAMGQFRNLWEGEYRGGLPMIFAFMNNFYGMGGQPIGETMGYERLARIGAGVSPTKLHAESVDGNNPLAVIDAIRRKIAIIKNNDGPVLLDIQTYRQSGHSPSDASAYREREEIEMWRNVDPIKEFGKALVDSKVATDADLEAIRADITNKVHKVTRLATDMDISPRADLVGNPDIMTEYMLGNGTAFSFPGIEASDVRKPLDQNSRVIEISKKSRNGVAEDGSLLPEGKCVSFRDGLFEALVHHVYNDDRIIIYGEENRDWDGAFAVYRGLTESMPYYRLFNSPISEGAIVGTAVGYALEGGRPIVELMYCDFLGRAGDEVFNQLSKWRGMSGGELRMPVVLRVSVGDKYGAQHSQDWTTMCCHVPGLKVVFPATPYDAKGLLASALEDDNPVVFFESQRVYGKSEIFHEGGVPEGYYTIPIGLPEVKVPGGDLTILTFGATLYRAHEAVKKFKDEYGISVELIDGRSLVPFDYEPVIDSVKKTGCLIVASDACERGSYLHNIASNISQLAFDYLDAPVVTLGAKNWITPPGELEHAFFPQPDWFIDAYSAQIAPLQGRAGSQFAEEYRARMSREGM